MSEPTDQEKTDWPLRSRFRKSYQPYGIRVCEHTLDEIHNYDDCKVMVAGQHHDRDPGDFIAVVIKTREGQLQAEMGDWIMEDSEGHHYPIAHEELRKTYEPVPNE